MEFQGLKIKVEYPRGSFRERGGRRVKMLAHYGEVEGTRGLDGDPVDVFVGPDEAAPNVYVITQMKQPTFEEVDEEKCVLGCASAEVAKALYLMHYDRPGFFGGIKELPMQKFKERLQTRGVEGAKLARCQIKLADEDRVTRISNGIDNLGLGVLASPYIARGIAKRLSARPGRLGRIGGALNGYADAFHHLNRSEVAGLALVAPGITHPIAKAIDRRLPSATPATAGSVKAAGLLGALGTAAKAHGRVALAKARQTLGSGVKAVQDTYSKPSTVPKLLRPANLLRAGAVGAAGLGVYGAYKGTKALAHAAGHEHTTAIAPPTYSAPRVL